MQLENYLRLENLLPLIEEFVETCQIKHSSLKLNMIHKSIPF